jgi:DNA-binding winged helix-turn-helix (wHTH) protein
MEHILFLNCGYPLEPLCRSLRAGGATSTVTEDYREWQHLKQIREWSLTVVATETIHTLPTGLRSDMDTALLVLDAEDQDKPGFNPVWRGTATASTVLRACRYGSQNQGLEYTGSNVLMSVEDRTLWHGGLELLLTAKQLGIVRLLISQPGRIFSRMEIWEHCWGLADYPESNAVDAHIRRIRRKLPPQVGRSIITVYGLGYRFVPHQVELPQLGEQEPVLLEDGTQLGRQPLTVS